MELNKKNVKTIIFIIVVAIVVYTILQNIPQSIALINWLLSMFKPMLYGLFIAIILVVPMRLFETKVFAKLKVKESAKPALSLVATLISALLVVGIAMFMIVPQFVTSIKSLLANIPTTVLNLQLWVSDILTKNPEIQEYLVSQDLNIMEYVTGAFRTLSEVGTKTVTSIVSYTSTFVSGVFNFVIGLIFASYALLQKERLTIHFKSLTYAYLHENTADRIIYVVSLANATFSNFVAGQSLEALILGYM
jgi:predicted PurR-regulated permease PerM